HRSSPVTGKPARKRCRETTRFRAGRTGSYSRRPAANIIRTRSGWNHAEEIGFAFFLLPEHRLDAQLALLLINAANVVAQDFAKHFVHHRIIALRPDAIAKLAFDRGESRFHVRPLVIMLHVFVGLELEVMKSLLVCSADCARSVALEGDVGLPAHA